MDHPKEPHVHPILQCQTWLRRYLHKSRIPDSGLFIPELGEETSRGGSGQQAQLLSPVIPPHFIPQLGTCGPHSPCWDGVADKALPPSEAAAPD